MGWMSVVSHYFKQTCKYKQLCPFSDWTNFTVDHEPHNHKLTILRFQCRVDDHYFIGRGEGKKAIE